MNGITAIYGHHGNGKTRTLNFVRELIRENRGESLSSSSPYTDVKIESFCYKKQIICVCLEGDSEDIIITVSRTRGVSVAYVK